MFSLENIKMFSSLVLAGTENARVLAGKQKNVFKLENRKMFSVENIKMLLGKGLLQQQIHRLNRWCI
jgi:hypothetical protein